MSFISGAKQPILCCTPSKLKHHALAAGLFNLATESNVTVTRKPRRGPTCSRLRYFSTPVSVHAEVPAPRHHALTLIHKTRSFLPHALVPIRQSSDPEESLDFWDRLLEDAHDELSPGEVGSAKVRLTVYSIDPWSGGRQLLRALLEDPFASEDQNSGLRNRLNENPSEGVTIESLSDPSSGIPDVLQISSSWLQQFPVSLQITEWTSPSIHTESQPPRSLDELQAVFKADIPIVLCNPITTPLTSLPLTMLPLNNSNTIIILTSSFTDLPPHVKKHFAKSVHYHEGLSRPIVLCIDPARALAAVQALQSNPSSPIAVQKYQGDFSASNLSALTDALTDILSSTSPADAITALKTHTAAAHVRGALAICKTSLQRARKETDTVCLGMAELTDQAAEAREKAQTEVLGGGEEVRTALDTAKKELAVVVDRLTWWRMMARVDEIGEIIGGAVEKLWCAELEKKLTFHVGRLSALQKRLTTLTLEFTSSIPSSSRFHSPLLLNTLHQYSSSPSYLLIPAILTSAIHSRRSQIIAYPTARLHLAAQNATLAAAGSLLGGAGTVGLLEAYSLVLPGIETGTAVGLGVFGALAGVRWAVGRWEKAKQRWWEDWERVGEGLGRDLKETLDQTMTGKVAVVVEGAASGFKDIADKRNLEIEELEDELEILETELRNLEQRVQ